MKEIIRKYEGLVINDPHKFNEYKKDMQLVKPSPIRNKKQGVKKQECPSCKTLRFCELLPDELAQCLTCKNNFKCH